MTTSLVGCEQDTRTLPSTGLSNGSGPFRMQLLFLLCVFVPSERQRPLLYCVNLRCRTLSIESGPGPWSASVMSAARYNRSSSYPTGPNWAPEAETLNSFTELNPYGRWTVTIATIKIKAVGMLAQTTKAPSNKARPPTSSVPIVIHAATCGSGTPICCKIPANPSGPLDNLAKPCSMKP